MIDDNLYVEDEIGISAGGNQPGPLRFKDVKITNNPGGLFSRTQQVQWDPAA